jgi:signal transduction histidine kinase
MKHNTKLLKKLRNNYFALSSSVFLVVIIGSFAAIYVNTYINVQQEISERLENTRANAHTFLLTDITDPLIVSINLSATEEITSVNSMLDLSEETLEQMVDSFRGVATQPVHLNVPELISVGGRDWRVVFSTIAVMTDGIEHSIIFLDVTEFNNTLSSLLYTLLLISVILFPIVVGLNYFLANRAVRPIAEAWEKQKQFISDASHELKTPITIIKSNLGLVISNPSETVNTQMEWLNYVNAGADRMSKLANDLLYLANADSPNLQINKDSFDISVAITNLICEMTAKANERNTKITTCMQPNIAINSDQEKILQIATILFDNAIKYSEPNGCIEISLQKINRSVHLSVSNSGKGIKKTDLENIFERFYQTDPSRNSENEGFGLGLSIAKVLTDRLGGSLSVASKENEKTTFTLVL